MQPLTEPKAMTNESISGFLNSIAEAKRAFDAEPQYQSRIQQLEGNNLSLSQTIAARELRIHELKNELDRQTQALRSAEVERDDAGFRHLEADDKVQNLLVVVRGFIGDALKVCSAVTGEEQVVISEESLTDINKFNQEQSRSIDNLAFNLAEREKELQKLKDDMRLAQEQLTRPFASATLSSAEDGTDPWYRSGCNEEPIPSAIGQGQSAPVPTSGSAPIPQGLGNESVTDPTASILQGAPNADALEVQPSHAFAASPEGQSDGPFAKTDTTGPVSASSTTVETSTDAVSNASPPERNRDRSTFYKGRKYYDVTYYVPLHSWLDGGGTKEDYDWRPLPEVNRASHNS